MSSLLGLWFELYFCFTHSFLSLSLSFSHQELLGYQYTEESCQCSVLDTVTLHRGAQPSYFSLSLKCFELRFYWKRPEPNRALEGGMEDANICIRLVFNFTVSIPVFQAFSHIPSQLSVHNENVSSCLLSAVETLCRPTLPQHFGGGGGWGWYVMAGLSLKLQQQDFRNQVSQCSCVRLLWPGTACCDLWPCPAVSPVVGATLSSQLTLLRN